MANLRNTIVNGDLTVTGKVNFFDETVAPSTQSEIVQATNMVISDKLKNLTGNDIIIETSSNGNIYHKKGEASYKVYDTSNFEIDTELKSTSINPVQNKVIKTKVDSIDSAITSVNTSIVLIRDTQLPALEQNLTNSIENIYKKDSSGKESGVLVDKVSTIKTDMESNYIPYTGGTIINETTPTVSQIRNITISTSEPNNNIGKNGDIWFLYT